MNYFDELAKSMTMLGENEKTIFLGQAVLSKGTSMTSTLSKVPDNKKIEWPVCEEFQMGVTNGLALNGHIPVSIFPRLNFLLLAINQLVNHADKLLPESGYKTKMIIRSGIGSKFPLNPQSQHYNDYTDAFKLLCNKGVEVIRLDSAEMIFPSYKYALEREDGKSTLLIEWSDMLGNDNFKIEDYGK